MLWQINSNKKVCIPGSHFKMGKCEKIAPVAYSLFSKFGVESRSCFIDFKFTAFNIHNFDHHNSVKKLRN